MILHTYGIDSSSSMAMINAGHYVPQLAKLVYERINKRKMWKKTQHDGDDDDEEELPAINLKGFLV